MSWETAIVIWILVILVYGLFDWARHGKEWREIASVIFVAIALILGPSAIKTTVWMFGGGW